MESLLGWLKIPNLVILFRVVGAQRVITLYVPESDPLYPYFMGNPKTALESPKKSR